MVGTRARGLSRLYPDPVEIRGKQYVAPQPPLPFSKNLIKMESAVLDSRQIAKQHFKWTEVGKVDLIFQKSTCTATIVELWYITSGCSRALITRSTI